LSFFSSLLSVGFDFSSTLSGGLRLNFGQSLLVCFLLLSFAYPSFFVCECTGVYPYCGYVTHLSFISTITGHRFFVLTSTIVSLLLFCLRTIHSPQGVSLLFTMHGAIHSFMLSLGRLPPYGRAGIVHMGSFVSHTLPIIDSSSYDGLSYALSLFLWEALAHRSFCCCGDHCCFPSKMKCGYCCHPLSLGSDVCQPHARIHFRRACRSLVCHSCCPFHVHGRGRGHGHGCGHDHGRGHGRGHALFLFADLLVVRLEVQRSMDVPQDNCWPLARAHDLSSCCYCSPSSHVGERRCYVPYLSGYARAHVREFDHRKAVGPCFHRGDHGGRQRV